MRPAQRLTVALVATYLLVQCVVPLRHYLYPGDVNWTEEGHRFSWHMKLRDKVAEARFVATDPATHATWLVDLFQYLTPWFHKMTIRPDIILQFSHHLATELGRQGHPNVEIRAEIWASLRTFGRTMLGA